MMEHEEVGIAGHDQVGFAIDRHLEEFVIPGVPADLYPPPNVHERRCCSKAGNKSIAPDAVEIAFELRTIEHFPEFLECRFGEQERIDQLDMVEDFGGCRFRQKSATDQYVGIDDDRQSATLVEDFRQDFFREALRLGVGSQLVACLDNG